MKSKLLLGVLLATAAFVATPHAEAMEQNQLKREIATIEAELSTARSKDRRMELVRELQNNREQLSVIQRREADARRRVVSEPASDRIIERQAQILEESREFLPEEIAHLRQRNLMERVSQDALEAKQAYDTDFSQKVVSINTQIANLRAQIKKLEEHKVTLVREYHNAVAELREAEDIPLRPITTPTHVLETQQPLAANDRNNRGYVGGVPGTTQPVSNNNETISGGSGGGGVRHYLGSDFHAH